MRWPDERYVRVYTRDTGNWIRMPWEARAVFVEILRKVDRAGILDLGDEPTAALADLVRIPADVVTHAVEHLESKHWIKITGDRLTVPNFFDAQESRSNDRQRKRDQRERDAVREQLTDEDSHQPSPEVTKSHSVPSVPYCAVPSVPSVPSVARARVEGSPVTDHGTERTPPSPRPPPDRGSTGPAPTAKQKRGNLNHKV